MERKTILYLLFGILLTINMDCKTTNSTTSSATAEISKEARLCQQTFKSGENEALEKYTDENGLLVKTERFNSKGESLFTEVTQWSDENRVSKTRKVADKDIFRIQYSYENGLLTKQEIDDTNGKGELMVDGKADRVELFSYSDEKKLDKISIKRKDMPVITVQIAYSQNGQETTRTTTSEEKILQIQNSIYKDGLKTKSTVKFPNGTVLSYAFSYDDQGQLIKTTRSGSDETPSLIWSRRYDCK